MTPDQFFTPLLGQSLLYPGQSEIYRGQCVQSVLLWLKATGTNPPIYPSAADYFTNGIKGYTKIQPGQPILNGDIVVWGKSFPPSGGNGHIDVASSVGNLNSFSAYDSNWAPLKLAHILHTGNNNNYIAGYLRKEETMSPQDVTNLFSALTGGEAAPADLISRVTAKSGKDALYAFISDPVVTAYQQDLRTWKADAVQLAKNAQYVPYTGPPLFLKKG